MVYLKPQNPIQLNENYIYPLTTADQVMLGNGNRLNSLFKKTIKENVTLQVANWSNTKPYTQTITLNYSELDAAQKEYEKEQFNEYKESLEILGIEI